MPKQLKDLFNDFLEMSPEEQIEKVRQVRHTRTIERPKAAIKRQKKQLKKDDKGKSAIKALIKKMSPEEKQEFLNNLAKKELKT